MSEILLSICIPTYNRSHDLERCLKSILLQLEQNINLGDVIEVVISDNCSPDNTQVIAEQYQNKFKNFRFSKNVSNLGFDENVISVVQNASGTYCWYMGDDDMIINGALDFVVSLLKGHKYDIVGIEGEPTFDKNEVGYMVEKKYQPEKTEEVIGYNDFYFKQYLQGGFSFMIFDRNLWLSVLDRIDYLKHWLYYENVAKMSLVTKKPMLHIEQPLIMTGQDCRWSENGNELFTYLNSNRLRRRLMEFGYDKLRLTKELNVNNRRIPMILLGAKVRGLNCNLSNFKTMFESFAIPSLIQNIIASIIFFIPNSLVIFFRSMKRKVVNLEKNR